MSFIADIVYYSVLLILVIPASVSDLRSGKVNNVYSILIAIAGITLTVFKFITDKNVLVLLSAACGSFLGFAFTFIPALKGRMGGADVKIAAAVGLGFGIRGILLFLFVSFTAAVLYFLVKSVIDKICKGSALDLKKRLPLVPFMITGIIVCAVYSSYLNMIS